MGILDFFSKRQGKSPGESKYKTTRAYDDLRNQVLQLNAAKMGADTNQRVIAVLMETGFPEAVATLVATMDGAASLYFSSGGGTIGAGEHPGPNAAARKLVAAAAEFESICTATKELPLPQEAHTRFYLVTPQGVLTFDAIEDDLGHGPHPMSPLFHTAHELIFEIRRVENSQG